MFVYKFRKELKSKLVIC